MLTTNKAIFFLGTTDRERSLAFYEGLLGLRHAAYDGFADIYECGGLMMRVSVVEGFAPQPFTVLGWEVADVPAAVAELKLKGIALEMYPFADPESGIWTMNGDQIAWFKDPDGNLLSVSSFGE